MSRREELEGKLVCPPHETEDDLDADREHTDLRVENDAQLAVGGHAGLELAPPALTAAERRVRDAGLEDKRRLLILDSGKRPRFAQPSPRKLDFPFVHSATRVVSGWQQ